MDITRPLTPYALLKFSNFTLACLLESEETTEVSTASGVALCSGCSFFTYSFKHKSISIQVSCRNPLKSVDSYPGSEVPKSVRVQVKTAVRRTSERSERRGKNLWSPWTITSFWSLPDCMSNCFVRTSVAPQFDYKNVSCALRRNPGGKDK